MSSVFGSLSSAAAALEAQRRGLEVAGQNIANVNTAGYTRRTLELKEIPAAMPGDAGGGVAVAEVRSVRDLFLEARLRQEQQGVARDTVIADASSVVEAQLGQTGASVDAQLSAFFDAFSALANDPGSSSLRDAAAREADRLGVSFREMSDRFDQTRRDADQNVRSSVDEINGLTSEIGKINERVQGAHGADYESLIDTRTSLLAKLSALTDVSVSEASGVLTVSMTGGQTLVAGAFVSALSLQNDGNGLARVISNGQDITSTLTTGALGGQLYVRDTMLPGYGASLDQLAYDVANAVNAVHTTGTDALGNPGGALFDVSPTVAGAAASFQLNAAVANDSQLIAAGGATANDTASGIAALRNATFVSGSTPTGYWGQLVYRVGADSADAQRAQSSREQVMTQLQQLRDATSGVSIDEEAASLMKYQRAYEANARYFTLVNEILDTLMEAVR